MISRFALAFLAVVFILPGNLFGLTRPVVAVGNTYIVISTLDTPDANPADGNGEVKNDRVFQTLATANNVSLSDLTIRNSKAPSAGFPSLVSGGIYRDSNINFSPDPS